MNFTRIHSAGSSRLILIFAGWGIDPGPFAELRSEGYDIAMVWDYRDMSFSREWLEPYSEVCVLAWSMGVAAAAVVVPLIAERLTRCVAVNGTLTPVDDAFGIPCDVFRATLDNLSEASLPRFDRRMCGSASAAKEFSAKRMARPIAELREELEALAALRPEARPFSAAVVSRGDLIFPACNQAAAWRDKGVKICYDDGPHLPDMQRLINSFFIDKSLVESSFSANSSTYALNAKAQLNVAERLLGLIETTGINPAEALEIGCGVGTLTQLLLDRYPRCFWRFWDITPNAPAVAGDGFRQCDAETAITTERDGSLDLIVTASTMQWFNSPQRFLHQSLRVLRPGGYMAFSTFAEGNLPELVEAGAGSLPLLSPAEFRDIIPDGFEVKCFEAESLRLEFESPRDLLRHLRLTGVNALARKTDVATARRLINHGISSLTYLPIIGLLKKKQS